MGNRLTKESGGVVTSYSYDAADENTVEWTPTTRTTYSGVHPERGRGDANGNLTLSNAAGSLTTYAWDIENRLVQVQLPAGGTNTMSYYGDGKRRRYGDSAGGRVFLWDGNNIVRQTGDGGVTNRTYTIKPSAFGKLISQDGSFHHGACPETGMLRARRGRALSC